VGPPGIGKTQLALHAATDLQDEFEDGVCFVDLSPVRDPELVPAVIVQSLSLLSSGAPVVRSRLFDYLRDRQLLLLLDNFEQVMAAAGLVRDLLAVSPWLKVLVTSRVALRLRGESRFRVPPLPLPDLAHLPPPASLVQCPSIALFVERAAEVDPGFALTGANAAAVAALCCRLDGLPLAIELLAARCAMLSPQMLLERLSGRLLLHSDGLRAVPERQRTLSAALDWSYDLLEEREQALFRRLSVFSGGWTLEAAEVVASDSPSNAPGALSEDVLDLLAALVSHSLVQRQEAGGRPRFALLAVSREYAWAHLQASAEAAPTQQRHAEYCLALAESAEPHLTAADALPWLDCLEHEHDNQRAALSWLLGTCQAEPALRLAGALWRFWRKRGHASEGRQWLQAALDLADADGGSQATLVSAQARAKALLGAGGLARTLGAYGQAKALHEQSLALYRQLGDETALAYATYYLGADAYDLGDLPLARSLLQQSLVVFRQAADPRGAAAVLLALGELARDGGHLAEADASFVAVQQQREHREAYQVAWSQLNLGELARLAGRYERATAQLEESLALFRELDDFETVAMVLHRQGELAADQGDPARARACLEESLLLSRRWGFRTEEAVALRVLGLLALVQGCSGEAADLCQQSLALLQETGEQVSCAQALGALGWVRLAQGEYAEAAALFRESLAGLEKMGYRVGIPACLEGLARVHAAQGHPRKAGRGLAMAAALRQTMGVPLPPAWPFA